MKKKLSVEGLASDIQHKGKSTTTTAFFKSILLKKLTGLKFGRLTIADGSNTFSFGDNDSEFHATITVTSQEFYGPKSQRACYQTKEKATNPKGLVA